MTPYRVDHSALRTYHACPFKWWLRYVLGLTTKGETAVLLAGQAWHEGCAVRWGGGTVHEAMSAFNRLYAEWAQSELHAGDPHYDRLNYDNVSTIVRRYFEQVERPVYTVVPELLEAPFEAPLDEHGEFTLIGRIDAPGFWKDQWVVGENKSTGWIDSTWKQAYDLDTQLNSYTYGLRYGTVGGRTIYDGKPIAGAWINAIEFSKLPSDPIRRCRVHNKVTYAECRALHAKWDSWGPIEQDEATLHEWRAMALAAATRMRELAERYPTLEDSRKVPNQGRWNAQAHCRYCEFASLCKSGRDPILIEANTIYRPWNPLEHARQAIPLTA